MRIQTLTLLFAMMTILLIPIALNGCGSDTTSDSELAKANQAGIYILGPGFEHHTTTASLTTAAIKTP